MFPTDYHLDPYLTDPTFFATDEEIACIIEAEREEAAYFQSLDEAADEASLFATCPVEEGAMYPDIDPREWLRALLSEVREWLSTGQVVPEDPQAVWCALRECELLTGKAVA